MKITLTILLTFVLNFTFGQNLDTEIYSNETLIVKMRLVNQQYGVFIYEWPESKEHRLFTYQFQNDTLFIQDSDDELDFGIDVFYNIDKDLDKDSVSIETSYTHLLEEGQGAFTEFSYLINDLAYVLNDADDVRHKLILDRNQPLESITIAQNVSKDRTIPIELPSQCNSIIIKFTQIFSTYYSAINLEKHFPLKRELNNVIFTIILNK
jgi:hypothetical protein